MYKVSFTICFIFANPAIALFTLIISGGSFEPSIDQRATLVQVLTAVRIWIVVAGFAFYSWKSAINQPSAMMMGVLTTVACITFLEDYMVLDGVLFVAINPFAQAVVFTRPNLLVGLTCVAFKQREIDLRLKAPRTTLLLNPHTKNWMHH